MRGGERFPAACMALHMLAACGGQPHADDRPPARPSYVTPETSSGPGQAGLVACQSLVRAMDAWIACASTDDERLVASWQYEALRRTVTSTAPIQDDAGPLWARTCLGYLDLLAENLADRRCDFVLSGQEREWLHALWQRRTRVPVAVTGAERTVLERLAQVRDRACACANEACLGESERELDSGKLALDASASALARATGSAMLDELVGCRERLHLARTRAARGLPTDPAVTKAMAAHIRAEAAAAAAPPPPDVPPVTLPDGRLLSVTACLGSEDAFERDVCLDFLEEMHACRKLASLVEADACARRLVSEYMEVERE